MKKKLVAMLLCAVMAFSVGACGNGEAESTEDNTTMEEITITKEDLPEVELVDYSDINAILTEENKPSSDEIEQEFSSVVSNIGFMKVTDRDVIQEGDIVKVDYTGYQDGVAFGGGTATNTWLDVSNNCGMDVSTGQQSGGFIDGFTAGLLGKKVGETVSYEVTFPEEYPNNPDLAGVTVVFEFFIHSIHTNELITAENLTDELVKENFYKYYEVSTIEELKKYVEEVMNASSVLEYILTNSTVEITDKYLEYRTKLCLEYEITSYYGMDVETFLEQSGTTLEEMISEVKESFKEKIKEEAIYQEIAENEKLSLDEKAFKEYILTMFDEGATDEYIESYYEYMGSGSIEDGKTFVMNQKVVSEYLMDTYRESVK